MDKLKIVATGALNGEIVISGAKNAALPLMCAGLLSSGTLRLKNVPMLADVKTTQKLLQGMGARVLTDNNGIFTLENIKMDNNTNILLDNLYDSLKELASTYKDNINVKED